jgi:hypothetical protein
MRGAVCPSRSPRVFCAKRMRPRLAQRLFLLALKYSGGDAEGGGGRAPFLAVELAQALEEARGIPAAAAHLLHLLVELID